MHGLHMSEMFGYDDDGADIEGVDDIDTSEMAPYATNGDFKLGGSPTSQAKLRALIKQYSDIFSNSVKGKAMAVPPMEFTIDHRKWETVVLLPF